MNWDVDNTKRGMRGVSVPLERLIWIGLCTLWFVIQPVAGGATQVKPGLSAVQMGDSIHLEWPAGLVAGRVELRRWADGEPRQLLATLSGAHAFDDHTAQINRLYNYALVEANGRLVSQTYGVRSDVRRAFTCPRLRLVEKSKLGVDRTEEFGTPSGKTIAFTIHAPVAKPTVIAVAPCHGKPRCSDHIDIAKAIATVVKAGGGRVQLEAGDYELRIARDGKAYGQIEIDNASDVVLAGANEVEGEPATRITLDAADDGSVNPSKMPGLSISGSHRILIRDIALDWSRPLAIPGTVVAISPTEQRFTVADGAYYISDPAHPPAITLIDGYDPVARTYIYAPWSRNGFAPGSVTFNPSFATDHTYSYVFRGREIPDGSTVVGVVGTGPAIRSSNASDIVFEDVQIWGGGGAGFVLGPNGRGFRITNSKIIRKPDKLLKPGEKPRLISLRGDSDARGTEGELLIEGSEIGFMDDDAFNIVGTMVQGATGSQVISASEFKLVFRGYDAFAHDWTKGDTLLLRDPVTLQPLAGDRLP